MTRPNRDALRQAGEAARSKLPLASQAEWRPAADRADPVALLQGQEADRIPELDPGPLRPDGLVAVHLLSRRGPADGSRPRRRRRTPGSSSRCVATRISRTSACSPRPSGTSCSTSTTSTRRCAGPFEWDLKRLAASLVVAGRSRGFGTHDNRHAVHAALRSYRERMTEYATMRSIDVYYAGCAGRERPRIRDQAGPADDRVDHPRPRPATTALHELPKLTAGRRRPPPHRRSPARDRPPPRSDAPAGSGCAR